MSYSKKNQSKDHKTQEYREAEHLFAQAVKGMQPETVVKMQEKRPGFARTLLRTFIIGYIFYELFKGDFIDFGSIDQKESEGSQSSIMKALMGGQDDIEMQKNIPTRFSDVQGIDEFKDEL